MLILTGHKSKTDPTRTNLESLQDISSFRSRKPNISIYTYLGTMYAVLYPSERSAVTGLALGWNRNRPLYGI